MAIEWGSTDQKQRNGIDFVVTAESSSAIRVEVRYYTQSRTWGFDDNQTMTMRGHYDKVVDFNFSTPANSTTTRLVHTADFRWEKRYGGGPTYSFGAKISGQYLGGNPDVVAQFTVPAMAPSPPNPPSTPSVSGSGTSLTFSWSNGGTNGASIDRHQILLSTSSSFSSYQSPTTTSNSYTFNNLSPGTTYYAKVRSDATGIGWSDYSGVRSATTDSPPSTPAAPTYSGVTGTSINWAWTAPANGGMPITNFNLHVSSNPQFTALVDSRAANVGSMGTTGLQPGTTYYARVRAYNAVGWGPWSGTRTVTTLGYPSSPGTPSVSSLGPDAATLSWTGSGSNGGSTIIEYQVQIALDAGFSVGSNAPTTGLGLSRTFTGLQPGTTYYARSRARNAVGWGSWSGVRTFQTLSGAKVLVNGTWVNGTARVRANGVWVMAKVHKRVNGAWVL